MLPCFRGKAVCQFLVLATLLASLGNDCRAQDQPVERSVAGPETPPPGELRGTYCFEVYCSENPNNVYMMCTVATGLEEAVNRVQTQCRVPVCGINGSLVVNHVGTGVAQCGICRDCAMGGPMSMVRESTVQTARYEIEISVCCCDGKTLYHTLPAPVCQHDLCQAIQTMRCIHAARHGGARWTRWICRRVPSSDCCP